MPTPPQLSTTRGKVEEALDALFLTWADRYIRARRQEHKSEVDDCKAILSMLFRHSAHPPKRFFETIAHDALVTGADEREWEIFSELIMSEVRSAKNPLAHGMVVLVALADAAEGAREAEQRMFLSLQKKVDKFVLKIFERLPQTVRGFENGMSQCSALFEPEGPRNNPCGRSGPLRVAFERREQTRTLCAAALLMDYLYRKFMNDLPDMRDSARVLQDLDELIRLATGENGDGLVLGVRPGDPFFKKPASPTPGNFEESEDVGFFRVWLQGANASHPSLTILPGAQFILAGILAKPKTYYRVPALRMALDFVIYIMMLAAYSDWVLFHDDGPVTVREIIFACYVLVSMAEQMCKSLICRSQEASLNYSSTAGGRC